MTSARTSRSTCLLLFILALTVGSVGCGGSGGGATGAAGSTSSVSGSVVDAAVTGALVEFSQDVSFTASARLTPTGGSVFDAATSTIRTDGAGNYSVTFSGTLPEFVFIRTTGGTEVGTGAAAPSLRGVSARNAAGGTSGVAAANGLTEAIVAQIAQGTAANVEEAYAKLRSVFPTLGTSVGAALSAGSTAGTLTGTELAVSNVIIAASKTTAGGTLSTNSVATYVNNLTSADATVRTAALTTLGATTGASTLSVNTNPTINFAISGLTVGTQNLTVPSSLTSGVAVFGTPSAAINIAGTTALPTITLSASNLSTGGFPTGTVFSNATLTITIKGTGTDTNRFFSIVVNKARATVTGSSVAFSIDQGATFTFTGKDSTGAPITQFIATNQGADQIATTNGSTFSFNTDTLINQLRARLGVGLATTHPAQLIASAGTFDLSFETAGIPFGLSATANSFGRLEVKNVQISGLHTFNP